MKRGCKYCLIVSDLTRDFYTGYNGSNFTRITTSSSGRSPPHQAPSTGSTSATSNPANIATGSNSCLSSFILLILLKNRCNKLYILINVSSAFADEIFYEITGTTWRCAKASGFPARSIFTLNFTTPEPLVSTFAETIL